VEQDVLVVGESLVDIVRAADGDREYAGGSAANVAIALARLGLSVEFATSWAEDDRGRVLAAHLARDGVRLATDPVALQRTSTAAATLAADGSASYTFDLDWRLNPLQLATDPVAVHACSISAVLEPGADDVAAILARLRESATATYDINVRAAITGTGPEVVQRIEALVGLSDLVKASDEDLEQLYPDRSVDVSAEALRRLGPAAVVVTRGGSGSSAFTATGRADVPTPSVTVADTIGAGDTFMAGLITGLAERDLLGRPRSGQLASWSPDGWAEVLAFAAEAAAINVSRPGCDPPYRAELSPVR
jgi:fructokinase